jgi:hypothetical protein
MRKPFSFLVQDFFGLEDRDHRQQADDQQERHQEQSDGAGVNCPIPKSGVVDTPG